MRERFNVNLKIWNNLMLDAQDKSIKNIKPLIESLDPIALNSIYQISSVAKSTALALAMFYAEGD